jgi:phosphoglycolate phosphatase-like HAD superfamily hydrolase
VTAHPTVAIADFDGTLVDLPIDWRGLRERLDVKSIDDLFRAGSDAQWEVVRDEELRAARSGPPRRDVIDRILSSMPRVAVLTANSERAVAAFLEREPALAARVLVVVGRETARGPKRDKDVFAASYRRCVEALVSDGGAQVAPVYFGDQDYELAYAADLGAVVVDVRVAAGATRKDAL